MAQKKIISIDKGYRIQNKQAELRREILRRIQDGTYKERIPDVHTAAKDLGANFKTVNKVLNRLVEEGVLTRKRGKGTYIREVPSLRLRLQLPERDQDFLSAAEAALDGVSLVGVDEEEEADIIRVLAGTLGASAGALLPLNDVAQAQGWQDLFPEAALRLFRLGEILYGLPVNYSPVVLYVNRAFFRERDVEPPSPDASLTDWCRLAAEMKDGHLFLAPPYLKFLLPFLWQAGMPTGPASSMLKGLREPAVQETLIAYRELGRQTWRDGYIADIPSSWHDFAAGRFGIIHWGASLYRWLPKTLRRSVEVHPVQTQGCFGTVAFGEAYAVRKCCTSPARAHACLQAFLSESCQKIFTDVCTPLPAHPEHRYALHEVFESEMAHVVPWQQALSPLFGQVLERGLRDFVRGSQPLGQWLDAFLPVAELAAGQSEGVGSASDLWR